MSKAFEKGLIKQLGVLKQEQEKIKGIMKSVKVKIVSENPSHTIVVGHVDIREILEAKLKLIDGKITTHVSFMTASGINTDKIVPKTPPAKTPPEHGKPVRK